MWVLLLSRRDDALGTYRERRQFDGGRITIGRSDECDWTIHDPDVTVSRRHAVLSQQGLDLYVEDTGSANGVRLNESEPLPPAQPMPVRVGDRVGLGEFVIEIASAFGGIGAVPENQLPRPVPTPLPSLDDPGRLFTPPPPPAPARPDHGGPRAQVYDQDPAMLPSGGGPVFGERHPFLDAANNGPAPVFGPTASPGPMGMPPAPARDLSPFAPLPNPFARPAAVADTGVPREWLENQRAPETLAEDFVRRQPPPAPPPPPDPTPERGDGDPGSAWAAFCRGAEIDPGEMPPSDEAVWELLGAFYRQAILGLSDLILDRAAFKQEFRIEATQIALGRNNPLKWLPPREAAKLLLHPPLPGYIEGDEAAREAVQDVKQHQLAMLAGVQQVLASVLEELSPSAVEKEIRRLDQGKPKGFLGLGRRGADPWTVYRTLFEVIHRESRSTDRGRLSDAFRRGYEQLLHNL